MTDGGGKVLVVDDDDVFRRSLVRMVATAGYRCTQVSEAAGARKALATDEDIAVVLCDIRMPGESGIDLLRHICVDLPHVAVIMITGIDDPEIAQVAFDFGAYGYLTKPFSPNELLIALRGAIKRRDLEFVRERHVRAMEETITRTRTLQGVLEDLGGALAESGANGDTIDRLSLALSLRDEETGRHIERMSRYAVVVAESLDLSDWSPEEVRLAAALHDVGKIGVPDSILLKPAALSADEYSTMQRHAQIGYQLLADGRSALIDLAADIALCHHEWWNGGGYPRGLKEDEIPPLARVAAVTDVFDALTSDRVYRPALSIDETMAMMAPLRGRHFEPRAFDAFVDNLDVVLDIRDRFPETVDEDRVRVLIVDDHDIFVQSLARLLGASAGLKVVGRATTVAEGVRAAAAYEPDVVLMDFELPDGDGAGATEQINALVPRAKVVMLTGRTDEHALVRAIGAGCAGFVRKEEAAETLLEAIRAAHEDDTVTSASEVAPLLDRLRPTRRGLGAALTLRELDVLALMADGLINKQIAGRMGLTLNTVRNHVKNVLYKLHAHSRLEAVATGVREGVIPAVR